MIPLHTLLSAVIRFRFFFLDRASLLRFRDFVLHLGRVDSVILHKSNELWLPLD